MSLPRLEVDRQFLDSKSMQSYGHGILLFLKPMSSHFCGGSLVCSSTAHRLLMYLFMLFQEVHVPPTPEVDTLHSNSNSQLNEGQKLVSSDKSHQLVMQHDGNLVCYHHRGSVWSSHTNNKCAGPFCLVMQEDRNAVIYAQVAMGHWDLQPWHWTCYSGHAE